MAGLWKRPFLEGITLGNRTVIIYSHNDLGGAWAERPSGYVGIRSDSRRGEAAGNGLSPPDKYHYICPDGGLQTRPGTPSLHHEKKDVKTIRNNEQPPFLKNMSDFLCGNCRGISNRR
ncbi:hypothetical protein [Candidatus Kuenenia stuttgartiensis]|uniref:hypothetical protein n=1 Tax=Kuenenia stuttgartiensis TaxID=174633 RepID=UPI00146B59B4|nr:hypothetical protein [Candidatus Kuenenia stuttgartiensis]